MTAARQGAATAGFECAPVAAPRYRAVRIDGEEELARIAQVHGVFYSLDQVLERFASADPASPDRLTVERLAVRGAYLVERLHPSGAPIAGAFEVLSAEAFAGRYTPLLHLASAA
ncbi:hypothetical protein [Sinomonas atrocyanea]